MTTRDPFIGRTLAGKYTLVRQLGAGGMGSVYEAVQLDLERAVAIKIVTEPSIDATSVGRLRQEAIAAARLRHPNVVAVFDLGTDDEGHPFIVMEQLVGSSLREIIAAERRLPVARAVRIALDMLDALGAAHAIGIVHRDVKPANVMVLEDDRVKLVDFGIARLADHEREVRTTTGTLLGTPAYLAPEQILCGEIDGRADLHAVGLCLFEMLLGARPWRGSPADLALAVLRETPPSIDTRRADVPKPLADVVSRALAKRPEDRHASAHAMSAALRASLVATGPTGPTTATPPAPPRAPRAPGGATGARRATLLAAGAAAAASVTLLAVVVATGRRTNGSAGANEASAPIPAVAAAEAAEAARAAAEVASGDARAELTEETSAVSSASAAPSASAAEPAATAAPSRALVRVACADPRLRFGHLCGTRHPYCQCFYDGDVPGVSLCTVPWVDGVCPKGTEARLPGDASPADRCRAYLYRKTPAGAVETWEGTGRTACQYCSLQEWRNEHRLGIPGAACTGVDPRGVTRTGRFQPIDD